MLHLYLVTVHWNCHNDVQRDVYAHFHWSSQSPDFVTEGRETHRPTMAEGSCGKGLAKNLKRGNEFQFNEAKFPIRSGEF